MKRHHDIHIDSRPFKCTFCEKSFRRKERCALHIRTHLGETPYRDDRKNRIRRERRRKLKEEKQNQLKDTHKLVEGRQIQDNMEMTM